jgi:hypothetical protein
MNSLDVELIRGLESDKARGWPGGRFGDRHIRPRDVNNALKYLAAEP